MKKLSVLPCLLFIIFIAGLVSAQESYEFEWEENDIVNGKEFEIKVNFSGLEDKEYDIKLWIENQGKIISERYDLSEDNWKSGFYYINKYVKGPGDKTDKIKIRINEKYIDFKGKGEINFRLRDLDKITKDIEILEKDETEEIKEDTKIEKDISSKNASNKEENITNNGMGKKVNSSYDEAEKNTPEVIILGKAISNIDNKETEDIKTKKIVYESKTEIIKKYSIYGFALFCVIMCVLVIWRKLE